MSATNDQCAFTKNVSLLEMPLAVANLVLEKLELIDLLRSRKVCRGLRTAVDKLEPRSGNICLTLRKETLELQFGKHKINYTVNNGTAVSYQARKIRIEGENFMKIVLQDLKIILKHVTKLEIVNQEDIISNFIEALKTEEPIQVKHISFWKFPLKSVILLLPYFNAKTLENIVLLSPGLLDQFEQIIHLEQWKSAKRLSILDAILISRHFVHLFHYEEFSIVITDFPSQVAIQTRDDLMRRSTFQRCYIFCCESKSDPIEIAKVFKPDYAGGSFFEFEYSDDINSFVVNCIYYREGIKFSVRKC